MTTETIETRNLLRSTRILRSLNIWDGLTTSFQKPMYAAIHHWTMLIGIWITANLGNIIYISKLKYIASTYFYGIHIDKAILRTRLLHSTMTYILKLFTWQDCSRWNVENHYWLFAWMSFKFLVFIGLGSVAVEPASPQVPEDLYKIPGQPRSL
mgnify:CR=1 FL=1